MAKRLYFGRGLPAVSPGFDAAWDVTGSAVRAALDEGKFGDGTHPYEGYANLAVASGANSPAGASDVLIVQYVSSPLSADFTISGAIAGQIMTLENNSAANLRTQMVIWVRKSDGTSRGTLIAADESALSNEWFTSLRNIKLPLGGSTVPTSVAALTSDRIVVELGYRKHENATTGRTGTVQSGNPTGTDLPVDETTITPGVPWIEFTENLTFDSPVARLSQVAAEVLTKPDTTVARLSQVATEALVVPTTTQARISQIAVEVLVQNIHGGTFTADAALRATASGSFTANAVIMPIFTANAVLLRTITPTPFYADAEKGTAQTTISGDLTANGVIFRTITPTATANAVIFRTISPTLTADAILRWNKEGSLVADAAIVRTPSGSFTVDAVRLKTQSSTKTADAVLKKTGIERTFTADAEKTSFVGTFTANAVIKATILDVLTLSFPGDYWPGGGIGGSANILTGAIPITPGTQITVVLTALSSGNIGIFSGPTQDWSGWAQNSFQSGTLGTHTFTANYAFVWVYSWTYNAGKTGSGTYWTDKSGINLSAVFKKTDIERSFTADAEWVSFLGRVKADAVQLKTQSSTKTANAVLKKNSGEKTFTADAETVSFLGSFSANAAIARTISAAFTANAVLKKNSGEQTLTADASITPAFRANAAIRRTATKTFVADAYFLAHSFTARAVIAAIAPGQPGGPPAGTMLPLSIKVSGLDITADVIIAGATFTQAVNARPGQFAFEVKDDEHIYQFVSGGRVTCDIDGRRLFDGYVHRATMRYAFPVDLVIDPTATPRIWKLEGPDLNILFQKRIVYDQVNPNAELPTYAAGSSDRTIILDHIRDYIDLTGDEITTDGVTAVGSPNPDADGYMVQTGSTWAALMSSVAQLPGAVWGLTQDRDLFYEDDDTESAPFVLSDTPNGTTTIGYANFNWTDDGTKLVNDAQVWGAGTGSVDGKPTYAEVEDATSIAAHGRWQLPGQFRGDMFRQTTVTNAAESIVYGSPQNLHGGKDPYILVNCRIKEHGLRAGQKIRIINSVFGLDVVLPIRRMTMTFVNPNDVLYDLELTREIDQPWFFAEFAYPYGIIYKPGPGPKLCPPGYYLMNGRCIPFVIIPEPVCGPAVDWDTQYGDWEWVFGTGEGAYGGDAYGVTGSQFEFNVPANAGSPHDYVVIELAYASATTFFDYLRLGTSFTLSGTFTIPDSPHLGFTATTGWNFTIRFLHVETIVISADISSIEFIGSRVDLGGTTFSPQTIFGAGTVTPGTHPWTVTVTSTLVTATIAGHTLSATPSPAYVLSDFNALQVGLGEGVGTANVAGGLYAQSAIDATGVGIAPWCASPSPRTGAYGCENATRVSSTSYELSYIYIPGTSEVYLNGRLMRPTYDYTEDNLNGLINFVMPVDIGDTVYACYRAAGLANWRPGDI